MSRVYGGCHSVCSGGEYALTHAGPATGIPRIPASAPYTTAIDMGVTYYVCCSHLTRGVVRSLFEQYYLFAFCGTINKTEINYRYYVKFLYC